MIDDNGNPIKGEMSQQEVIDRLAELEPKNKEEEAILASKIAEAVEKLRKKKVMHGLETGFEGVFEDNTKERLKGGAWSDKKGYRHIASVPKEMNDVMVSLYGEDFYRDPQLLKEALSGDELSKNCLTVDPKTI